MSSVSYHLEELAIAIRPGDSRRIMPTIEDRHRRILDVGCGGGQTLIASDCSGKIACGVDVDVSALQLGRRLSQDIEFVCAMGEALPFRDDSFDLVISRGALPYMNIPVALAEFARVSKPGGSLWVVLHPPSMALRALLASIARIRIREALGRAYVLANTAVFHLHGEVFPSPVGHCGRESCQTTRGVRRALLRAGYRHIGFRRGRFFVATAEKPG
jgi:ubiquinone/menaquinone biosynthesis C-methylase UbiE